MLTKKDYCDYDTCVALKELGYKESCLGHYFNAEFYIDMPPKYYQSDRYVSAPTLYEAQKWLREEKRLHIEVRWYSNLWYEYEVNEAEGKTLAEGTAFKTYEEALSTAVYMATEYLKKMEV